MNLGVVTMIFRSSQKGRGSTPDCPSASYTLFLCLCLLLRNVLADALLDTIKGIPELSTLHGLVTRNSNLTSLYSDKKDYTLLAPSNNALTAWLDASIPSSLVEATLRYHLLKQSITTDQFSEQSIFTSTYLENRNYTNITSGQVVELVARNGKELVLSANHTESVIISRVCYRLSCWTRKTD